MKDENWDRVTNAAAKVAGIYREMLKAADEFSALVHQDEEYILRRFINDADRRDANKLPKWVCANRARLLADVERHEAEKD